MKKKLHVILVAVMILSLSLFVGCGGDKTTDSTDKNQTITEVPAGDSQASMTNGEVVPKATDTPEATETPAALPVRITKRLGWMGISQRVH